MACPFGQADVPEGRMAGGAAVAAGPQGSTDGRRAGDAGGARPGATTPSPRAGEGRRPPFRAAAGIAGVAALRRERRGERAARGPVAVARRRGRERHRRGAAELRHDEPAVETVEKGLKAAKAAGVPVDLDGAARSRPRRRSPWSAPGSGPRRCRPRSRCRRPSRCRRSARGKAGRSGEGRRPEGRRARKGPGPGGRRPTARRRRRSATTSCSPRRSPRPASVRRPTRRSLRSRTR